MLNEKTAVFDPAEAMKFYYKDQAELFLKGCQDGGELLGFEVEQITEENGYF